MSDAPTSILARAPARSSTVSAWLARVGRPEIHWRMALGLLALFLGVATAQALALHGMLRARGIDNHLLVAELVGYESGAIGAWMGLPMVHLAVVAASDSSLSWSRIFARHLGGYAAFTAVHTTSMIVLRRVANLALGDVAAPFPPITAQVLYECQADLLLYPALAGLWFVLRTRDQQRAQQLRTAQLERTLAEARLDALTARLDPHFLFNALHTVGSLMHEDVPRTERLLANIGELLRSTLHPDKPVWTLREERAHTERYVDILAERFGDRVSVRWEVDERTDAARVPRFAIQSLVENAIKHNEGRDAPLRVAIDVQSSDDAIEVRVDDDGGGFPTRAPRPGEGTARGLARLEETLRLVFGDRASLMRSRAPLGGARVVLRFPREVA